MYILGQSYSVTVTMSTFSTTCAGMMASQTTDLPRPIIVFITDGFLSEQKLPLKIEPLMSRNCLFRNSSTFSVPYKTRQRRAMHSPQADRHMAMCIQDMLTYSSYISFTICHTSTQTLETMFIPIASPVLALKRMKSSQPATVVNTDFSLAYLLVELNSASIRGKLLWSSNHNFIALERREGKGVLVKAWLLE